MRIWPLDKIAMDNKMIPLETFVHEEMKEVVQIEEVEDVEESRDGVILCHYFVKGESNNNTINPILFEEDTGHAITLFLTLP